MPALTTKQISLRLRAVPSWSKRAQTILRTFKFEGFSKGIDFVNRIARKAQKTIPIRTSTFVLIGLRLKLTTHDQHRIDRPGSFMKPTILTNIKPGNPTLREEFFGPVALFFRIKNEDEAEGSRLTRTLNYEYQKSSARLSDSPGPRGTVESLWLRGAPRVASRPPFAV